MSPPMLLQSAGRPRLYLCRQCALRSASPKTPKRPITQNFLRKTIEAEWQWKEQAREIKAGNKQSFLSMLEERGYVKQITSDRTVLENVMNEKRIGAYVGIDPTAPSLHVGHLLPFMVVFWMYLHGFHAVTLLGGATAKVGDPTGRTTARDTVHSSTRKLDMASMHIQLRKLWMSVEAIGRKHGYVREWAWKRALVNNNTWANKVTIVEFLKVLGSGIRLGTMLSRDTVKLRQEKGDGMSFAEFTYPLLQAWDWWHLYHRNAIQLQIGGSDQFGNIVAGIDAINYIRSTITDPVVLGKMSPAEGQPKHLLDAYGLTVPLLTTPSGEKFGKSAGNAIWLDKDMTSSFDLYGFWVKTADSEVERYLKLFTFLPLPTIRETMEEHQKDPSQRVAQHLLAAEAVELAHGAQASREAAQQHKMLFAGRARMTDPSTSSTSDTATDSETKGGTPIQWHNAPSTRVVLPRSLVYGTTFSSLLWSVGLVSSKSEGHRLVKQQGAYVGSRPGQVGDMGDEVKFTPIKHQQVGMPEKYIIGGDRMLLRMGKWKVKFVQIISDEEFAAKGLTAPGWDEVAAKTDSASEKTG